jgi:hypothetical protein
MALDWKTGVREWLIGLGLPPSNVFDHLYTLDPRGMLVYSPVRPLFSMAVFSWFIRAACNVRTMAACPSS